MNMTLEQKMNVMLKRLVSYMAYRFLSLITILMALGGVTSLCSAEEERPTLIYSYGREECEECRSYRLNLFASGRVLFEGTVLYYELPPSASKTVRREIRETTVSAQSMSRWVEVLTSEDFFSLLPRYYGEKCAMDDRSEQALTLSVSGKSKTVAWVGCPESEVPLWLRQIANDMRKQVNPDQWLKLIPDPHRQIHDLKLKSKQSTN